MRGFWNGVAAGLGLIAVELAARVAFAVPTLPELLQDRIVHLLPGPVFSLILDRLYYLSKPLLFAGLLLLQVVAGGVAARLIGRRSVYLWSGVLWLATGLLMLPLAGVAPFGGSAAVALATLVAFAAYAVGLSAYRGLPEGAAEAGAGSAAATAGSTGAPGPVTPAGAAMQGAAASTAPADPGRRRLIGGAAGLVASAILARWAIGALPAGPRQAPVTAAGGAGAGGGTAASGGSGAKTAVSAATTAKPAASGATASAASTPASATASVAAPPPGLSAAVTPAAQFYDVSKNLLDPTLVAAKWHLRVDGLVARPMNLSYSDVLAMPAHDVYRTLECISNPIGGYLISNGRFTGVRMADVLSRAGLQSGATVLRFTCADGYTEDMPLAEAQDPRTLLAYRLDGQPLPTKHGFPLRVLGFGRFGMKNPKWLTQIELARTAIPGFWEQEGWSSTAIVPTMSRIDVPRVKTLSPGPLTVAGIAYAGDRGIRRVEVSTDGGRSWGAARLLPLLAHNAWVRWEYPWNAAAGAHTLAVRAVDGTGATQTARRTPSYPNGATGYDEVQVQVAG